MDKDFQLKGGIVANGSLLIVNSTSETISMKTTLAEADVNVGNGSLSNVVVASVVNATSDVISTVADHGFSNGQAVFIKSSTSNPVGTSNSNYYFINARSANTLTIHTTHAQALAGTSNVNIQNAGSGTTTLYPVSMHLTHTVNVSNTMYMRAVSHRTASGNTGATAAYRIQLTDDSRSYGYVEFNPYNKPGGVAVGIGAVEALTVDTAGNVYVSANVVSGARVGASSIAANTAVVNASIVVGNSTVNTTITSTSFSGTSNNSSYAFGKSESALNVNNSTYAFGKSESALNVNNSTYAFGKSESALNVNNSTYAFGKTEGAINANSAYSKAESALNVNNSTYAFGKSESALNVNNSTYAFGKTEGALNANGATYLNGQLGSYYTNASNLSAGTIPNARILSANTTTVGIVQLVDSVTNTSITIAAAANSVKTAYTLASTASTKADTAYTNSVSYVSGLIANSSQFLSNTSNKILTPTAVWAAANVTTATFSANVNLDFATAENFEITLTANTTLGPPSNAKPGMSGGIRLIQDGTGSRILSYDTVWKCSGTKPALTTTAGASDFIYYNVWATNYIVFSMQKNVS